MAFSVPCGPRTSLARRPDRCPSRARPKPESAGDVRGSFGSPARTVELGAVHASDRAMRGARDGRRSQARRAGPARAACARSMIPGVRDEPTRIVRPIFGKTANAARADDPVRWPRTAQTPSPAASPRVIRDVSCVPDRDDPIRVLRREMRKDFLIAADGQDPPCTGQPCRRDPKSSRDPHRIEGRARSPPLSGPRRRHAWIFSATDPEGAAMPRADDRPIACGRSHDPSAPDDGMVIR